MALHRRLFVAFVVHSLRVAEAIARPASPLSLRKTLSKLHDQDAWLRKVPRRRRVDPPQSAAMTSPARAGCHPANRLGSTTKPMNRGFSLGSPESPIRPSRQFLAFPSLMPLTFVLADAARILGIGRRSRSSLGKLDGMIND